MARFELEGVTYYQEYRRCGKPTCHCQNGGPGHGPYWYARPQSGRVQYIGKKLPDHIVQVRASLDERSREAFWHQRELQHQVDALGRLRNREPLRSEDRAILSSLGYGDCLVSSGELPGTQEGVLCGSPGDQVHKRDGE